MRRYDANERPDPEEWLALDELERMHLVERYHRRSGGYGESLRMHVAIHCTVETQLAEGIEEVDTAFRRLRGEGLDRHEIVHAIGSVLAEYMFETLKGQDTSTDINAEYLSSLGSLTKESWYARYEDDA